jgi:hypothetical protein
MKGILKKLSRLSGINKITNKVIPRYRLCPYANKADFCNDCECSVCILNPYKTNEENERR